MALSWPVIFASIMFPAIRAREKPTHLQLVPALPPPLPPEVGSTVTADCQRLPAIKTLVSRGDAMAAFMAEMIELMGGNECEYRQLYDEYHELSAGNRWPELSDRAFGQELKFHGCKKYVGARAKRGKNKGKRMTMIVIPCDLKKRRRRQ